MSQPPRALPSAAHLPRHVARLRPFVAAHLPRSCRNVVDLDDLQQEIFIAALKGFHGLKARTDVELKHWLRKIAVARITNLAKKLRARKRGGGFLRCDHNTNLEQLCSQQETPSAAAERHELTIMARLAIDTLPPVYRAVLAYRVEEGMPYEQIAIRVGKTKNAVRSIAFRGLQELRSVLSHESSPACNDGR